MIISTDTRLRVDGINRGDAQAIRNLLTFSNPKYAELRRLGKWTGGTQRTVCYVDERPSSRNGAALVDISMPRGCRDSEGVMSLIRRAASRVTPWASAVTVDNTSLGDYRVNYTLDADLRDYQQRCVNACEDASQGYIVAPTGSGKTVIALAMIEQKRSKTMIVTHTKELAEQWAEACRQFLGLDRRVVGRIGGGGGKRKEKDEDGDVIVATVQTLVRRETLPRVGMIIVDEAHHTPASTWGGVLDRCAARYRYGLTATPKRRDGAHHLLGLYLGGELASISRKEVEDGGHIVPFRVEFRAHPTEICGRPKGLDEAAEWMEIKAALSSCPYRTAYIAGIATAASPCLVLTDYVDHAERLAAEIPHAILLHGQLRAAERRKAFADAKSGKRTIVATTGILGEGIDASAWSTLILALPFTSRGSRLNQAIGRVIRPAPGKTIATVIDLSDDHPSCWSAESGRRKFYRRLGAEVEG